MLAPGLMYPILSRMAVAAAGAAKPAAGPAAAATAQTACCRWGPTLVRVWEQPPRRVPSQEGSAFRHPAAAR